MLKSKRSIERIIRHAAVVSFLRRFGPLTSAELARLLDLKLPTLHKWMLVGQDRYQQWVRMPNGRRLLLQEEAVEPPFEPLPIRVRRGHRRSVRHVKNA